MKFEIRIYEHKHLWFYVEFTDSEGRFYYTETGKHRFMDYGGIKSKTETQRRRLGKWWETRKP